MGKIEFYKNIKIAGLLSFIPLILFTGPYFGYICGDFLQKKLNLPSPVLFFCIAAGSLASLVEIIRIIKIAKKTIGY